MKKKNLVMVPAILLMMATMSVSCGNDNDDNSQPAEQREDNNPQKDGNESSKEGDEGTTGNVETTGTVEMTGTTKTAVDGENGTVNTSAFKLNYFAHTGCKQANVKGTRAADSDAEYFKCTAQAEGVLSITHVNSVFCCDAENMKTRVEASGNEIRVYESCDDSGANCVCPYDLSYEMGPLNEGKYRVIVYKNNLEYTWFEIVYNSDTQENILVK